MSKSPCYFLIVMSFIGTHALADPLNLTVNPDEFDERQYNFDEPKLGGFERVKVGGMKVRGWQIGKHTHFGQAKVNDKWGLGFVVNKGNTSYGVNHRGIEFSQRF